MARWGKCGGEGGGNKAHHGISTVCVCFIIIFFSLSEEEDKTTQKLPPNW